MSTVIWEERKQPKVQKSNQVLQKVLCSGISDASFWKRIFQISLRWKWSQNSLQKQTNLATAYNRAQDLITDQSTHQFLQLAGIFKSVQEWLGCTDHNSCQLMRALHAGMSNEEPKLETEIGRDPKWWLSSPNLLLQSLFYIFVWVKYK